MNYDQLIDYLESKNMDNSTINIILNFLKNKTNDFNVIKPLEDIYGIFSYVGFSNEQIEMFITKNTSVLGLPKIEIIKIAYVLHNTGFIEEMFDNQLVVGGLKNYKRIFMRDLIAKKTGRYNNTKSLKFLTFSDSSAYGGEFKFDVDVFNIFWVRISSDAELESLLNKSLLSDNKHISVNDYINKKSLLFYNKYLE